MERTVPSTASEEIELYQRTYYSLLRSSSDVQIRSFEEAHGGTKSLLHPKARDNALDFSAFIYCLLRLPAEIHQVELVVLGQSPGVFTRFGFMDIESWSSVTAVARRRRCFFNGFDTLACLIASVSDIDDVIPILTAYQIEWNKLHNRLSQEGSHLTASLDGVGLEGLLSKDLAAKLNAQEEDIERLMVIWGTDFYANLKKILAAPRKMKVRLLSGSLIEYRRATDIWWDRIAHSNKSVLERPIYFISSNQHSVVNLLSGFTRTHKTELVDFLNSTDNQSLQREWEYIQTQQAVSSQENFLYYILKKYQQAGRKEDFGKDIGEASGECGMQRISSEHSFDVDAQVIEINQICTDTLDSRVMHADLDFLSQSDAVVINIDYPLGMAAYNILSEIAEHVAQVLGIYIMGKSASLNGTIGDVVIPNVVHDEHSKNTYLFQNCFRSPDVSPYLMYGTVLDNQKCVSVRGTFLQNTHYMQVFYREGYTDIEMEAGPYMSAIYEMHRPQRHPVNEIVNLYELGFDLGVIHYVSDNPMGKGKNLGAGSLSYYGMDSTYAATVAIIRRIFQLERDRLKNV